MNVAIIGGSAANLQQLDDFLMNLMDETGVMAFTVIGGFVGYYDGTKPLSAIWASHRGYPFRFYEYKDINALMKGITDLADYAFFINDGNQLVKRFIMYYKDSGKHGRVLQF